MVSKAKWFFNVIFWLGFPFRLAMVTVGLLIGSLMSVVDPEFGVYVLKDCKDFLFKGMR